MQPHTITWPFGSLTFMSFPERAENFKDFPDGCFKLSSASDKELNVLFYRLDLEMPKVRRELKIADEIIRNKIMNDVSDYIMSDITKPKINVSRIASDLNRLRAVIEWAINPASVKGTLGTVQLIHGSSSANEGYNNFEIYLPRGIKFRMVGYPEDAKFLPFPPLWQSLTGNVEFAGRRYRFSFLEPRETFNRDNQLRNAPKYDASYDDIAKYFSQQRGLSQFLDQTIACNQVRLMIYNWFPFIKEYAMLGAFIPDEQISIATAVAEFRVAAAQ